MRLLLRVIILVLVLGFGSAPTWSSEPSQWLCDGDPLSLTPIAGAVDFNGLASTIPNVESGTVPGDGVVIEWRGQRLQLPRTNNAGAPSYTDGRWWWRAADPAHPEWKQRRGGIISYACTVASSAP